MAEYILVPQNDENRFRKIEANVSPVIFSYDGSAFSFSVLGARFQYNDIFLKCSSVVVLSSEGRDLAEALATALESKFGRNLHPLIDLSEDGDDGLRGRLYEKLFETIASDHLLTMQRNVQLLAEASALREQYTQVQESFSKLESYVYGTGLTHRQTAVALLPFGQPVLLALRAGKPLMQRLPGVGAGLSDFAVCLGKRKIPTDGTLIVRLRSIEDERTFAVWTLTADQIKAGWLRFSLISSLAPDVRAVSVEIFWDGDEPLWWDQSQRHPDTRFQSSIDGNATGYVLALKTWTYVPGCISPAPYGAFLPTGDVARTRKLPTEFLERAVNLSPENEEFAYLAEERAVRVHVLASGVALGAIYDALQHGATSISCSILTRAEQGPDIEYAMAVAPVEHRSKIAKKPDLSNYNTTLWRVLPPAFEGQLFMDFDAPLDGSHDVYLLTRLPEGVNDARWGWSTFFNFEVTEEQE